MRRNYAREIQAYRQAACYVADENRNADAFTRAVSEVICKLVTYYALHLPRTPREAHERIKILLGVYYDLGTHLLREDISEGELIHRVINEVEHEAKRILQGDAK